MKNIMLDTCVFMDMLPAFQIYLMNKEKGLYNLLQQKSNMLFITKTNIYDLFSSKEYNCGEYNKFKNSLENLKNDFDLDRFNGILKSIKGNLKKYFKNNSNQSQKDREKKDFYNFLNDISGEFNVLKNDYKNTLLKLNASKLFEKIIDGIYSPYIAQDSVKELENHIAENISKEELLQMKNNGKDICEQSEVDSFLKLFTGIIISNKEIEDYRDKLSAEYRGINVEIGKDSKPMNNEKNSNNEYADSNLVAISAMANIPLITNNLDHFVFSQSENKNNEDRRNHIKNLNEKNKDKINNVYPLTIGEVLEGQFEEQTENPYFETVERTFDNKLKKYVEIVAKVCKEKQNQEELEKLVGQELLYSATQNSCNEDYCM